MKRALLLSSIIFCIPFTIFAQKVKTVAQEAYVQDTIQEESYPIPGSHLLREKEQKILEYFRQYPDAKRLAKPRSTAWNFSEGDTKTWWASSFATEEEYEVPSTCRKVGTNSYIFVSDSSWAKGEVDQTAVDAIVDGFDNTTPAFPSKGIFQVDTETFGDPPNVDSDPKIIILILDIDDGYDGSGGYIAGYFYSINEYPDGDDALQGAHSNYAEIFYMDSNPANLLSANGRNSVLNTTAHEFQHMIHWNYDINESAFVNEGLSEIASYICGYGLRSSGGYASNPNVYLFGWDEEIDVLNDYSRAALWTLYLYEQFPDGFLKDLVQKTGKKNNGINTAMYGTGRNYSTTYVDWIIANYLQDKSIDPEWGYDYSPIAKPNTTTHYTTTATGDGTLKKIAAEYITFASGTPFKITFTAHSTIDIKAIKIGPSGSIVEPVTRGVEYDVPDFGTTYTEVTFVLYRDSEFDTGEKTYSYIAVGSGSGPQNIELAFEDGEPEGYLKFKTADSSAVFFSGISGAKLDSIRVAFRRSGNIQMDISELDGQTFMRGTNLYGPVQVNSPDSTASIPYPVPYDNWVTIDLTGSDIDASKDFIVSFLIGINPAEPGIMISSEPDDGERNSRTYYAEDDKWYSVSDGGTPGNIFKYLIRAYVSVGVTNVLAQPTITSIVANQGNVQLNWDSSAGPVAGYNIYRGTNSGFIPDAGNKITSVDGSATNYTDALPNIQANTDYYYRISSFDGEGNESAFSEEVTTTTLDINNNNGIPIKYKLNSNHPNPFNPRTTFRFSTPKDGLVKFTVHDLLGRVIYSENRDLFAGNYSFTWDGQNNMDQQVVSGVYFLRMEAKGYSQTRKMLMMK